MELDAVDRKLAVSHGHHLAVVGRRGDLQRIGNPDRRERVVPPTLERMRQPVEKAPAVVMDRAGLAVDQPLGLA